MHCSAGNRKALNFEGVPQHGPPFSVAHPLRLLIHPDEASGSFSIRQRGEERLSWK